MSTQKGKGLQISAEGGDAVSAPTPTNPGEQECAICFSYCERPTRPNNCQHFFCSPCINDWVACRKNSCPACRSVFQQLIRVHPTTSEVLSKT